jgi:hypothetical protein
VESETASRGHRPESYGAPPGNVTSSVLSTLATNLRTPKEQVLADDPGGVNSPEDRANPVVIAPDGSQVGLIARSAGLSGHRRVMEGPISMPGGIGFHPDRDTLMAMRSASLSREYISLGSRRTNSPHEFYRYPGRFSPAFARTAIDAFSQPNDLILDPFVGGGTTAVEALVSGRRSLVADLNPLATFVTRVKTRPLEYHSQTAVRHWIEQLPRITLLSRPSPAADIWLDQGYLKGLDTRLTWRIAKVIRLALAVIDPLDERAAAFCRCIILRTAQWAFDMRSSIPSVEEFRTVLIANGHAMLDVAIAFAGTLPNSAELPYIVEQGVPGLADLVSDFAITKPALVLTSPPYPGVYVNYHRWKLLGRREIRAPYWIANKLDGNGLAYYTMHSRAERKLTTYFDLLRSAFDDIARLVGPATTVVQLVGFNNPPDQVSRYLRAMSDAGFQEVLFPELATAEDGRLWRSVPSRRWWTEAQSRRSVAPHTAQEVVLIHRLRPA